MPCVSIIIPVYNTEHLLERCLNSVSSQTFSDWEAICVDDGSSDGSLQILQNYAAFDKRFKVFHIKNGGAAVARNFAAAHVSGKYCVYLDSDDFLHPQLLEICVGLADANGSDIVAYTYDHLYHFLAGVGQALHFPVRKSVSCRSYDAGKLKYKVVDDVFDWVTENSHPKGPEKRWLIRHCQPWRCMIRTEVAAQAHFCPGVMFEDFPWWGEILLGTRKACILNLPLYYYYPNISSYIHSSSDAFQILSLKKVIPESERIFRNRGTERQRRIWESEFLSYYKGYLEKKLRH